MGHRPARPSGVRQRISPISCFGPAIGPHPGSLPGPFPCPLGDGPTPGPSPAGGGPLHQGDRPCPPLSLAAAQEQFTATLSAVEDAARFAFRRRRRQDREEALAEARAAAWSRLGRAAQAGARTRSRSASTGSPTTRSATSGAAARSATRPCGRGAMDVYHPQGPAGLGFKRRQPRLRDEADPGSPVGSWKRVAGRGPPGRPGRRGRFRVDFEGWLAGLPERKRRVARVAGRGARGGRRGPPRRDLAVAGQPTAGGAGRELAGVPGASLYP